jgi:transcriptional regulator with XRE-family HTH domain
MSWGAALRKYRKKHNRTIEQIADELGIESRTVRRWEANVSRPADSNLAKLRTLLLRVQPISVDRALVVLVETCSKPAMLYDRDHRLVMTSLTHRALYNYRLEDALGLDTLQTATSPVRTYLEKNAEQIAEWEQTPTISRAVFRVLRRPDDPGIFRPKEITYLRANGYVVRDDYGEYMGSFTIADIIDKAAYDALPDGFVPDG